MKIRLFLILLFLGIIGNISAQKEITKKELKEHVSYLASDELTGRKPGTDGGLASATYIAKTFKKAGLKLQAEKGFQYFDVITGVEFKGENKLSFPTTSENLEYKVETDFMPLNFSKNGSFEGEVVFAGYGFDIQQDELKWNDYEGIDAKGKWVIVLKGDPEPKNRKSKFIPFSNTRSKTLTAKDKGAIGIIFVSGEINSEKEVLPKLGKPRGLSRANIPAIEVKREIANKLLTIKTVSELEKALNTEKKNSSYEMGGNLKVSVGIAYTKTKTQNIIAFIEGSDPKLKDEIIVIGGHYDHLGMGGFGSGSRTPDTTAVHNGADDNASGIAAIMEIAEQLAANKKQLKRSFLVIAFGAEEMGLLGSKYFTTNPLFELKQIKAMLNFDMIGRLDTETKKLSIGGTGTSSESENILTKQAEGTDLELSFASEGFGPSDHASFYVKDIPVFFISSGAHGDYHTPKDDTELINFEGLNDISNYGYKLTLELLNRKETLIFKEAGPKSAGSAKRGYKVTLGIMPAFGASKVAGLAVDAVMPGRPAEKCGMKKADIITAINGKEITNIYDYMNRLQTLKVGETITVDVLRKGKKEILLIQL